MATASVLHTPASTSGDSGLQGIAELASLLTPCAAALLINAAVNAADGGAQVVDQHGLSANQAEAVRANMARRAPVFNDPTA